MTTTSIFECEGTTLTRYSGRRKHLDTFPPGIETIGSWVFYGRRSLESIVLPQGLKSIEGFAFMDCTNLKRLVISPTNEEILGILLCECRKIEKVEFNDGTEADLEVIKKKGAQVRRRRLS